MKWKFNDGGRSEYFKGTGGDCVARAISIASGIDYMEVYNRLAEGVQTQRKSKRSSSSTGKKTALHGINVKRKWFKDYMTELGFEWTPCMSIGSGCKFHFTSEEMPSGRIVASLSKHYSVMIDGIINDTYDPSRDGTRCVYGYYKLIN